MATRDATGVLRPGMFEEVPLSTDPDDDTVGVITSGRGHKVTMVAKGKRAIPGVGFQAVSTTSARWRAEGQGAVKPEPF